MAEIKLEQEVFEAIMEAKERIGRLQNPSTSVGYRESILEELEKAYIPILMRHADLPHVRGICEEYNEQIKVNGHASRHNPIRLGVN